MSRGGSYLGFWFDFVIVWGQKAAERSLQIHVKLKENYNDEIVGT